MANRLVVFKILFLILIARSWLPIVGLQFRGQHDIDKSPRVDENANTIQQNFTETTSLQLSSSIPLAADYEQQASQQNATTTTTRTTTSSNWSRAKELNIEAPPIIESLSSTTTHHSNIITPISEISKASLTSSSRDYNEDGQEEESSNKTAIANDEANDQNDNNLNKQNTVTRKTEANESRSEKLLYNNFDPVELCYLSNGGSSLTLTVNEATPVGAIIGTIEVNGDPSMGPSGNIDLTDMTPSSTSNGANNEVARQMSTGDDYYAIARQRRKLERRWAWWPNNQAVPSQASGSGNAISDISNAGTISSQIQTQTQIPPQITATLSAQQILKQQTNLIQAPVQLEPGTKNLILVRPLDKEAPESDQTLLLNVKCQPRASSGINFNGGEQTIIPVRLIVTDANDNAPEFINTNSNDQGYMYVLNISEATPVGSLITRDIQAIDRDSAGPHSTVHYRVEEDGSQHANLLHFSNPLECALRLAAPLDYESLPSFTVTILAEDQGEPEPLFARAQVRINVIDSDDQNPKFLDDKYTLVMDESQQNLVGQNLHILPHSLRAQDGDRSIQAAIVYSLEAPSSAGQALDLEMSSAANNKRDAQDDQDQRQLSSSQNRDNSPGEPSALNIERYLHLSKSSGEIRLLRVWPADWSNGPLTLVVRATQADNEDRYTLTTLTITNSKQLTPSPSISSSSSSSNKHAYQPVAASSHLNVATKSGGGIQFVTNRVNVSVPENTPINERIGQVKAVLMPTTTTNNLNNNNNNGNNNHANDNNADNNNHDNAGAGSGAGDNTLNESVDLISSSSSSSSSSNANTILVAPGKSTSSIGATTPLSYTIKHASNGLAGWERQPRLLDQTEASRMATMQDHKNNNNNDSSSQGKQLSSSSSSTPRHHQQRLNGRQVSHNNQTKQHQQQQQHQQLPPNVSYQILDDQTDQFGVNQGGEIFLKKTLDFEARQEFLFRILATHSRYSDICHVQVNVMNVNDNKPKFTLPQYNFHLTEGRLRSSPVIGTVQAQDGDLRDAVRYSLAGDQANLFELNATSGQLSLRASPSGTLQMPTAGQSSNPNNPSANNTIGSLTHQLTVFASDTLGPKQHSQSARINLIIAPQLIGRSLSMSRADANSVQSRLSNRADPPAGSQADWTGSQSHNGNKQQQQARSSVATVMASLQHMVRSASLSEMPLPSALLLSALLALLICLLSILIVAISVHFYKRQAKSRAHRHQFMAASLAQAANSSSHFRQAYPIPASQASQPGASPTTSSSSSASASATSSAGPPSGRLGASGANGANSIAAIANSSPRTRLLVSVANNQCANIANNGGQSALKFVTTSNRDAAHVSALQVNHHSSSQHYTSPSQLSSGSTSDVALKKGRLGRAKIAPAHNATGPHDLAHHEHQHQHPANGVVTFAAQNKPKKQGSVIESDNNSNANKNKWLQKKVSQKKGGQSLPSIDVESENSTARKAKQQAVSSSMESSSNNNNKNYSKTKAALMLAQRRKSSSHSNATSCSKQNFTTTCSDNSLISSSVCSSSSPASSSSTTCASSGEPCLHSASSSAAGDSKSRGNEDAAERAITNNVDDGQLIERIIDRENPNSGDEDEDDDGSSIDKCGHYSLNRSGGTYDKRLSLGEESARLQSLAPVPVNNNAKNQDLTNNKSNCPSMLSGTSVSMLSPAAGLDAKSYRRLELINSPRPQPTTASDTVDQLQAPSSNCNKQTGSLMGMIKQQAAILPSSIKWPQEAIPQRTKQLTWDDELSLGGQSTTNTIEQDEDMTVMNSRHIFNHQTTSPLPQPQPALAYNSSQYQPFESLAGPVSCTMPPAMCNMGPYALADCSEVISPQINGNSLHAYVQQQGGGGDRNLLASPSFLFSSPNSPSHLNRWLDQASHASKQPANKLAPPNSDTLESSNYYQSSGAGVNYATENQQLRSHLQNGPASDERRLNQMALGSPMLSSEQPSICCDGQDNCFDYTIVQSSQFHVDSFVNNMQQRLSNNSNNNVKPNYGESNNGINNISNNHHYNQHNHQRSLAAIKQQYKQPTGHQANDHQMQMTIAN